MIGAGVDTKVAPDAGFFHEDLIEFSIKTNLTSPTSTSDPTSNPLPELIEPSGTSTGGVFGGVIGGIAVLVLGIGGLLFLRRRRRGRPDLDVTKSPNSSHRELYGVTDPHELDTLQLVVHEMGEGI